MRVGLLPFAMIESRHTRAVVDLARLERNYQRLRSTHRAGRLMTVLKANAYGHGLVPMARFLQGLGQELFSVARLSEALALREAGIGGRILVLGPPERGRYAAYSAHGIELTVASLEGVDEALEASLETPLEVHLKLDTGMGRIGLLPGEGGQALALLNGAKRLRLRGIYSHFAEAERMASGFCEVQCEAFERFRRLVRVGWRGEPPEFHLCNSAGLLRDERYHYDYARVGFALWAPLVFAPSDAQPPLNRELEQVLTLRTSISHVKRMKDGMTVGYGRNYACKGGETIATLPVGYGDGYFRTLSNKGFVLIGGRRRPIVGNVSMDQTTVSLGEDTAAVGDEAVLLGGAGEPITLADLGAWAGTIDYEVLTNLSARVPREYVRDGEPVDLS
jgi:alanine racemase